MTLTFEIFWSEPHTSHVMTHLHIQVLGLNCVIGLTFYVNLVLTLYSIDTHFNTSTTDSF